MSMDSVSHWIEQIAEGDETAARELFDRYYARLIGLARRRLCSIPPEVADAEGAAASAFRSFFGGVKKQKFSKLDDRDDLWKLLATITARKAVAQVRKHWKKRGERANVNRTAEIAVCLDKQPTPEQVVSLLDECESLVYKLEDETLQRVALLRLEGYGTDEIAQQLQVHRGTAQRKLTLIESQWIADSEHVV